MQNDIVLLFEDTPGDRDLFETELRRAFRGKPVEVLAFKGSTAAPPAVPYEVRIANDLGSRLNRVALIVCDQDLSGIDSYVGLSETNVSAVADDRGLPMTLYARGKKPAGKELLKRLKTRKPWTERKVVLDLDGRDFAGLADDSVVFYDGFRAIHDALNKKKLSGRQSLAATMAEILGEPEIVNQLALYSSGDQQYLQNIMPAATRKPAIRQASTAMGYWLWESILRFPGILVNEVAAASLLNIDAGVFVSDKEISDLFKTAKYHGPFSEARSFWWRQKLQRILDEAKVEDGLGLVKQKFPKKNRTRGCFCSVDHKKPAGFYCMVTEKPVSEGNSRGKIAWLPAGADLARVENTTFDQKASWLGLF